METKKGVGDIMNQFGIISDLLEKINLDTDNITVNIGLKSEEFDEIHNKVVQKRGLFVMPKRSFNVTISGITFTFKKV
tara:strand:+ start:112 stop:345 length:234 start_codon:yes stop_codon:yes gene_type:complete